MNKFSSFDLAFIGSGISSTYTLYHFLKHLEDGNGAPKISIALIDKYPSFHCGIPYGERSGTTTLLITSLRNFLPEPQLSEFLPWLNANKDGLLSDFVEHGGPLSLEWIQKHEEAITNNEWEELFIPRRFFGHYIEQKINALIKILESKGQISISYITGKVIDMAKTRESWEIHLKNQPKITSKKAILAIGSLPTNYLWKDKKRVHEKEFLLINDPYSPKLSETLQDIRNFALELPANKLLNVAIIGANASGLEMLYQLNDHPEIKERIQHFYMLSSQGLLPDSKMDEPKLQSYQTIHLDKLEAKKSLSASDIAEAVYKDLDEADNIQLGAASTVGVISRKFGALLDKLEYSELEKFACFHGNEIGRRQRCAGEHYANTAKTLELNNQFTHIPGRFADLVPGTDGFELIYQEKKGGQKTIDKPINLVINCIGGMKLSHPKAPRVLRNLMERGVISQNESEIGIRVNEQLEAAENLHIMGPLLAGNIVQDKAVWHVEHCGRIISFSQILADILIANSEGVNDQTYQLEIIDLEEPDGLNTYKGLIKSEWGNNPYYLFEYLSHHRSDTNRIMAFNFKKGTTSLVIMPMVIRQIELAQEPLRDAISPYGYSGPLYKNNTDPIVLKKFWEAVDDWYKKNDVVSEFVRFHLNGNHEHYSGHCVPTLNNVYGPLLDRFEPQWDAFLSKVRNNYRKAAKAELTINFFEHSEIGPEHVADFYAIYVSTMKRNGASKSLYFSLEHFEDLILNNKENFTIVFVYKDAVPVSTELIIHLDSTLFAYLGGTLADYFEYRPNDFLRVEVIRWGIDKGYAHYVLGGGITNGDGLYKFKKSLFPNSTDKVFYTGRKIIDPKKYEKLCALAGFSDEDLVPGAFFPLYRKTID